MRAALYVSVACVMPVTVNVTDAVLFRERLDFWTVATPLAFVTAADVPLAPALHDPLTVAPETGLPAASTTEIWTVALHCDELVFVEEASRSATWSVFGTIDIRTVAVAAPPRPSSRPTTTAGITPTTRR